MSEPKKIQDARYPSANHSSSVRKAHTRAWRHGGHHIWDGVARLGRRGSRTCRSGPKPSRLACRYAYQRRSRSYLPGDTINLFGQKLIFREILKTRRSALKQTDNIVQARLTLQTFGGCKPPLCLAGRPSTSSESGSNPEPQTPSASPTTPRAWWKYRGPWSCGCPSFRGRGIGPGLLG